ncbi:hypothetical protein DERP_005372 [Dermatophagoides pteronyssinus]|uniref:Uncharacterized protein n=1 Tax=Dermatophagoides pteronyssinus TaxID=6956 RepID=A0ABQ8JNC3_DERPT|nr:hypothetical protein DERP_005372 [Dermatophagoides pteronyssinus]
MQTFINLPLLGVRNMDFFGKTTKLSTLSSSTLTIFDESSSLLILAGDNSFVTFKDSKDLLKFSLAAVNINDARCVPATLAVVVGDELLFFIVDNNFESFLSIDGNVPIVNEFDTARNIAIDLDRKVNDDDDDFFDVVVEDSCEDSSIVQDDDDDDPSDEISGSIINGTTSISELLFDCSLETSSIIIFDDFIDKILLSSSFVFDFILKLSSLLALCSSKSIRDFLQIGSSMSAVLMFHSAAFNMANARAEPPSQYDDDDDEFDFT